MSKSIYVICDSYDKNEYNFAPFIYTILYVRNTVCGISDVVNVLITENVFELCNEELQNVCDNIFVMKMRNNEKLSNYRYCELVYGFLSDQVCDYIFTPSSIIGRSICAWLSGKFNAGVTADVLSLENLDGDIFYKRATTYNNLLAKIVCKSKIQISSIQAPTDIVPQIRKRIADINYINVSEELNDVVFRNEYYTESYDMSGVVIGIGRGVGERDRTKIMEYANKQSIPIVCSRPLVESGVIPYSRQVGQSGKSISCNCYIAIGISGMIQHLVGIVNCKKVISINPDKNAPIHDRADVSIFLKASDIFI